MSKSYFTGFGLLRNLVLSVLAEDPVDKVVSAAEYAREIESLRQNIEHEQFSFIVDLPHFEITEAFGVSRWLGYDERDFSLKTYCDEIIHPAFRKSLFLFASEFYKALCTGRYDLKFMRQTFTVSVALKHSDGHYVVVKKVTSPFQYDHRMRLLAYVNQFTVVGNYTEAALGPRLMPEADELRGQQIIKGAQEGLIKMKHFSVRELEVARELAWNPKCTQGEIAEQLRVTSNTVNTYYKRFLKKARIFFEQDISTAREAARRLHNDGLI